MPPLDDRFLDELQTTLNARKLNVERVNQTFNTSQGKGVMANIDPSALAGVMPDDEAARSRHLQAYAAGVKHVLLEHSRSTADQWSFVDTAGRLLPVIMPSPYLLGVEAAAGHPPWTQPFVDDLHFAYLIRLDRGLRVLTTNQTQRWGVSDDRISSAARSLLFHRTRDLSFQPLEDSLPVHRLKGGDGHDAARCQVVADAFYTRVDSDFRFALPSPNHFLCVFQSSSTPSLQKACDSVYVSADIPLTSRLFRFETGTPTPIEESDHE